MEAEIFYEMLVSAYQTTWVIAVLKMVARIYSKILLPVCHITVSYMPQACNLKWNLKELDLRIQGPVTSAGCFGSVFKLNVLYLLWNE